MLIDPDLLWEYKFPILILTVIVMVGQICFGTFGVLLSGQPLKIAVQAGFSLAQIGEFAFILASLGLTLKVTDHFLYPIVVAVSVITTFFTPYMIRMAEPVYKRLDVWIPDRWKQMLLKYSSGSTTIHQKSDWHRLLKSLLRIVATYTSVSVVLIFTWLQYISPLILSYLPGLPGSLLSLFLILAIISPMLRAIIMKKNHSEEFQKLWRDSKYNQGSLVSLIVLRIILCITLVMIPVARLLNVAAGYMWVVASIVIVAIIFSRKLKRQSILMERRFFCNLTARELEEEKKATINHRFANHMLERDLHLADFEVRQNSPTVGKTLKELNFRKICNVNVVTIIRGNIRINIPGGDERLYPFDKIIVVGSDEDLTHFRTYIDEKYQAYNKNLSIAKEMKIEQFQILKDSKLVGRSIQDSGIRDKATCLVIGIEREETSLKNPPPTTLFEEGDIVWVVGEHEKIVRLSEGEVL